MFQEIENILPTFLSWKAVVHWRGLSEPTVRKMIRNDDFPRPVFLRPRRPLFSRGELEEWAARRIEARDAN